MQTIRILDFQMNVEFCDCIALGRLESERVENLHLEMCLSEWEQLRFAVGRASEILFAGCPFPSNEFWLRTYSCVWYLFMVLVNYTLSLLILITARLFSKAAALLIKQNENVKFLKTRKTFFSFVGSIFPMHFDILFRTTKWCKNLCVNYCWFGFCEVSCLSERKYCIKNHKTPRMQRVCT